LHLPVHGDNRGWFKENWQREKMIALGLPDFAPIQNNMSFNNARGATRGIHAEPWDKLVSVATGKIFGAWVDLREGRSFGKVFSIEMGPETAVFVPRGVGNSYQTLVDATAYSYLVNEHWSAAARESYTFLNLADETVAIPWPIPLEQAELSDLDKAHPRLSEVQPFGPRKSLVIGCKGQVGQELMKLLPDADGVDLPEFDLANPDLATMLPWKSYGAIYNAAAFTAVDEAETDTGRINAWAANVTGVANLVRIAHEHNLPVVHYSTDYVFDGTTKVHTEAEQFAPLGVYGQTKAAGDAVVSTLPRHYIIRTSWVVGGGNNFVKTMASLADRGVCPSVINDQVGRLTFADDLARAAVHLVRVSAEAGTYNLSCDGDSWSWADIAKEIFLDRGRTDSDVTAVSTEEYFSFLTAEGQKVSPRPAQSTLDLSRIKATGFVPRDMVVALDAYLGTIPRP
ncbi:MAG TPA: bifunctional dTDP-4-dehydrorhamnose 3,5-epimerase family protein/NAD(P)-dependent oxidoreductase, partial [Marmoricola sp.]|nr:bifunctional dTDP-4-dehydrorhamnose 3,5-epimerase family protein/NAD(P)-dependent oxidoreductase [Marmoricola sp.]